MRFYVLLGLLLIAQAWAKPKDLEENEVVEEDDDDAEADGGYADEEDARAENPCYNHECPLGQECEVDGEHPICICAHACPEEVEERNSVCSTSNVTFFSQCELRRQRCLCEKGQTGCDDKAYRELQMDYYGPCITLRECTETEMENFPVRMRNWLFLVMEELADRKQLTKPAMKIAKKAERQQKRWVLPAIWKFCDLDHSHDLYVDLDELMPITAPLKAMEHCTGPFIEKCDADGNKNIDLQEWGKCLGLDDEETEEDMEEMCKSLHHFS